MGRRDIKWLKDKGILHQAPYFRENFKGLVDPANGKFIGYAESGFKYMGLKKRIRAGAKLAVAQGLSDLRDMEHAQWEDMCAEAEYEEYVFFSDCCNGTSYIHDHDHDHEQEEEEDEFYDPYYDPYHDEYINYDY